MDWLVPSVSYLDHSNELTIIDFSYEFIDTINLANVKSLELALDIDCEQYFDEKFILLFNENLNPSKIQNFSILSRGGVLSLSEDFFLIFFHFLGRLKNMHTLKIFLQ